MPVLLEPLMTHSRIVTLVSGTRTSQLVGAQDEHENKSATQAAHLDAAAHADVNSLPVVRLARCLAQNKRYTNAIVSSLSQ